jgi:hypothetical protein
MKPLDDAARQIAGAFAMAAGRENWKSALDRSIDAVFASFAAFAFSAPLVVLFTLSARRAALRIPDFADTLYQKAQLAILIIGDLVTYAVDWGVSLALLLGLARATGAGKQAADLIVGYNWVQPAIAAVQLPPIAIMASTASAGAGGIAGLSAFAITLFFVWGVIRRGLNAPPASAVAILFMLIIVGALIDIFGSVAMRAIAGV